MSQVAALIERSLGAPEHFATVAHKSRVLGVAGALGLRAPQTLILRDLGALADALAAVGLPAVIKADDTWGGLGVRVVESVDEASQAIAQFQSQGLWRTPLRRLLARIRAGAVQQHLRKAGPVITVQRFVTGAPAHLSAVCWQGRIAAQLCAQAEATIADCGPASVVRLIRHAEMTATSAALAAHLGLSGFCGFDFVLDERNRAWFLEINPRITPTAHLRVNADLCAALQAAITGTRVSQPFCDGESLVALFPKEWQRCPSSALLRTSAHDVPWHLPDFVRRCAQDGTFGPSSNHQPTALTPCDAPAASHRPASGSPPSAL
jgi:ATP-grasp domain